MKNKAGLSQLYEDLDQEIKDNFSMLRKVRVVANSEPESVASNALRKHEDRSAGTIADIRAYRNQKS